MRLQIHSGTEKLLCVRADGTALKDTYTRKGVPAEKEKFWTIVKPKSCLGLGTHLGPAH